jgi:predicted nucleotidyltransferase
MNKKSEILQKIKDYVWAIEPQSEVILFGSRARGEERADSDWDILILTPDSVDLKEEQKYRHKLFEIELEYDQAISTFVYSKSQWNDKHKITPLFQNIQREGITI